MADGAPPPEPDYSLIPLQERCLDKNWKARLSAYTDLITKFSNTSSDSDPFFRPYLSPDLLRAWATDSNAAAQEKGLECLCSLIRESGENSARTREGVLGGVVDKGFISTRAGTKGKAVEVALLYVEVESDGSGVVSDVLKGLDAKQPKLVATTVTCLKELVNAFGIKPLGDVKVLIKALGKIFAHTDKAVRSEGTLLAQAIYKYLGPALLPSLSDLKPVQQKELGEGFAQLDAAGEGAGAGKPTRLTRKEKRAEEEREAAGGAGVEDEAAAIDEPEAFDPLAFVQAVDVVPLFPDNFHEVISSKIWKEKVELLAECAKVLEKNPKVKDVPALGDIAAALGQRMTDTNVNVVSASAGVLATLAQNVEGKGFGKHKGVIVPPILDRLKEKKTMDALGKALDAIFETISFSDITGDCMTALQNKNPVARQGTLQFLARALQNTREAPSKSDLDVIAPAMVGQLGDSLEPVRSAAAEGLGSLAKIYGERPMNAYLEHVTDLQKAKVTEAMGRVEVKCKAGAKPAAKPAPAAAAGPPKAAGPKIPARLAARFGGASKANDAPAAGEDKLPESASASSVVSRPASSASVNKAMSSRPSTEEFGEPLSAPTPVKKAAPPARLMARAAAPPAAKKPAPSAAKPAGKGKGAPAPVSYDVKYKFAPEEAMAKAGDDVPADIQEGFKSAAWKERLDAASTMTAWIESGEGLASDCEVLFRFLGTSPGWGEKNFQVSTKVFNVMALLAQKSPTFGKSSVAQAVGPLTDKLGDLKLKKPAGEALVVFAEKTSLGFVLSQAYDSMIKQKAPKAQADALTWVKQAIIDFGIKGLALKDVINFLKVGLQSSNGTVRSSATAALVTLKLFVQTDLSMFLEELNPTLLTTINGEFDKIAGQTAPEPTRESEDVANVGDAGAEGPDLADDLEDLIPRVDLNKVVASTTVLKDSKSENWRVRKEAFEALEAELDRNPRLKPEMGEIGQALKLRMDDSNIAVKLLCLRIISKIAVGMGQPFQNHARLFASPIANICGDQKITTRNAATETLTAIADASQSMDAMVPGLASSLEKPNPVLRGCILAFIASTFAKYPPKADLASLLPSTLASLEDRNGDVRKAAQALLPFILQSVGYDHVMGQVSKLKPASKGTVTPLVQAARATLASSTSEPIAAEGKPATKTAEAKPALARAVAKPALAESNSMPESLPSQSASPVPTSGAATPSRPRPEAVRPRGMQMKSNALRAPGAASADSMDHRLPAPTRSLASGPSGLARPAAKKPLPQAAELQQDLATAAPFHTTDVTPKHQREKRDLARWTYDVNNLNPLVEYLQKQMSDHASAEVSSLLFSRDRFAEKDHTAGLAIIDDLYAAADDASPFDLSPEVAQSIRIANMDLALKYAGLRLHDGSTQMILKCLDLVQHIVESVDRARAGFSEAEGNVILPALIYRLGDNKYKDKLTAIFGLIDRTMPASRVMQLYVDYGIASSSSKTRAAAMEHLAQLIRRRGDVAASATNATKTYRRIAEFISSADSATRSAALDCIAYMYQHTGNNVLTMIGELPPKEKDLLKNRIDKMAGGAGPASSAAASTPPRALANKSVPMTNGTTGSPRSEEGASSTASSPVPQRKAAALSSKILPNNGIMAPTRINRIVSSDSTSALNGRDQVLRARTPSASAQRQQLDDSFEQDASLVQKAIHSIENGDPASSIEALKTIQHLLNTTPGIFSGLSDDLVPAITSRLQVVFRKPSNLYDPPLFRVSKHCVQTICNVCDHPRLVESVATANIESLIRQLSVGLLLTDTDDGKLKDMSKFLNLCILRLFATGTRIAIFDALFKLLISLALELKKDDSEQDFKARHAELILKCIWKRSKTTEDDLKKGILSVEDIFTVIEEFLQVIDAKEWKARAHRKVPLGDMPLRTIKVLVQNIFRAIGHDEVMMYLDKIYGDALQETEIYPFVYKLMHPHEDETAQPDRESRANHRADPPATATEAVLIDVDEAPSESGGSKAPAHIEDDLDKELEEMVARAASPKHTSSAAKDVARFLQAHPDKQGKYELILDVVLGSSPYKLFVKRSVDKHLRGTDETVRTPTSPKKTSPKPAQKRQSLAPGPPIPADADADTQLAMLKDKFQFLTSANSEEHPDP